MTDQRAVFDDQIRLITQKMTRADLRSVAAERFGDLVKAVVDMERKIMAIGGDLHADEEAVLLENGSRQADLWGINLYPDKVGAEFVEFDSMINIRPSQGNRSRGVEDEGVQKIIIDVVNSLVE